MEKFTVCNKIICALECQKKVLRIVFFCSNSHSDEHDILHCMERNGEIVEDNGYCDKWNG